MMGSNVMKMLIKLFGSLIVRRLSYVLAPLLVGWASTHWWLGAGLQANGVDATNVQSVSDWIIALLGILWMAGNEYIAWRRDRLKKNLEAGLDDLIIELYNKGTLGEAYGKVESTLGPVIKKALDKAAVDQAKKDALTTVAKSLILFCFVNVSFAQDVMPAPQTEINTNSIATLTKAWDRDLSTPVAAFNAVKDSMQFYGTYSWTTEGDSGAGAAGMLSLATISFEAVKFDVGPALVLGTDSESDIFSALEAAVVMKLIGEKFQMVWQSQPLTAWIPINWSGFYGFFGAGVVVEGMRGWEPIGFCVSVGGGGIKFGN